MPRSQRLSRQFEAFKTQNTKAPAANSVPSRTVGPGVAGIPPGARVRPATMDDILLRPGERGLILGMTGEGKTTLAENQIYHWNRNVGNSDILIMDSKPRFRAQWTLSGLPASAIYREWDYGTYIPGSVVIPMDNPEAELKLARSLGFRIVIAQIHKRSDIPKLDATLQAAYKVRKKNRKLLIYVDELNNFFKIGVSGVKAGNGIIMAITSGRERSTAFLGAGQRPRNISVEALESMTKLYWFYTPFAEDNKHLRSMDIPLDAKPPPTKSYGFTFFDRDSKKYGMCRVNPVASQPKLRRKSNTGWINYG